MDRSRDIRIHKSIRYNKASFKRVEWEFSVNGLLNCLKVGDLFKIVPSNISELMNR